MRTTSILLLSCIVCASLAFGQTPIGQRPVKGYTTVIPVKPGSHERRHPQNAGVEPALGPASESASGTASPSPLPSWNYSIVGYDGQTYTGTILGRSPYSRGKTTTTIPLQIVPLIITIDNSNSGNGRHTYDSSATDPCISPGSLSDVELVQGSPLLQNNNWTMNGVDIGNTQYEDAFQRAEFWSLVAGSPYHLLFSPTVLAPVSLTFGSNGTTSGQGTNYSGSTAGCPVTVFEGVVNINDMDNALQALIDGPLAGTINVGTFPIFLMRNVVMAEAGVSLFSDCCVLGYHSGLISGGNLQVYSPFAIDSNQLFGPGYTSTMAHEIGEAVNDPIGNNPTPIWGNEGQVVGTCQPNFEVGDPLSPGFGTPTNPFNVTETNGITYTLQELAFFNWFFGGTNLGAGGLYSNNGTFRGHAISCPPGGTN